MLTSLSPQAIQSNNPDGYDFTQSLFFENVQRGGLFRIRSITVGGAPSPATLPPEWTILLYHRAGDPIAADMIIASTPDGAVVWLNCNTGSHTVTIAAESDAVADDVALQLLTALPNMREHVENKISVHFWHYTPRGGREIVRSLEAPVWSELAENYHAETVKEIERLSHLQKPPGGKLILFHGPPGTGKTYAIRALLNAWSEWAEPHFVLDPERLLAEPGYLLELGGKDQDDEENAKPRRWRVLILEDADEYVSISAKSAGGPGMARLLNTLDGLIGQGLDLLLLLTTNEDVGSLQPAMIRAGRCLANVPFTALDEAEAGKWATSHGVDLTDVPTEGRTIGLRGSTPTGYLLANLYAAVKEPMETETERTKASHP